MANHSQHMKVNLQFFAEGEETESAIETAPETNNALADAFAAFGLEQPQETMEEETEEAPTTEQEEQTEEQAQTQRGIKVKYNKDEVFVSEDELPSYVQKGMNYEKVQGRLSEYQQALDRTAKLSGYRDHADLMANLDNIERQAEQQRQQQYDNMRNGLLDELETNGVDRHQAEQYLENHPILQQARQQLQEANLFKQQVAFQQQEEQRISRWAALYEQYPDIRQEAEKFSQGETPSFYTPQMQDLINRGYDPVHAYELAHRSTILETEKKRVEQKTIKQQQLNHRAKVEKRTEVETGVELSDAQKQAALMFGLDPKVVKQNLRR